MLTIERNYKMDNIRCILIFLVVMGHLLEYIDGTCATYIYKIIYSFHIPVFIFITGYFANFKPSKIFSSLLYPYFLFQFLYILFNRVVLADQIRIQFTVPHWLLWYQFACAFFYCLIPLIETDKRAIKITIISLSLVVSLLAGYDNSIGYYLSLSRILTFLPFFIIGYYIGHKNSSFSLGMAESKHIIPLLTVLLSSALIVLVSRHITFFSLTMKCFWGSFPYEAFRYTPITRASLLLIAFCWLNIFLVVMPKNKIFILSSLGANTFSIYLLHGFFIYMLKIIPVFIYSEGNNLLLAVGITLLLMCLLGNKLMFLLISNVCTGNWIVCLYKLYIEKTSSRKIRAK